MNQNWERNVSGRPIEELETPALVVDLEALQNNLDRLAGYFAGRRCRIRPHFKSHKCVTLANHQLAAGSASGIACAKVSEAEKLVAGGIRDILIANQVVGSGKAGRLAALNREAVVRAAVDSAENTAQLGEAARRAGVTIGVLVEVDVGMNRCGVAPGAPALELARVVAGTEGLRFEGLQGYEGHLVTLEDYGERRRRISQDLAALIETRRLIERSGLSVSIVSSGGTGSYDITGDLEGIDEVQCGSYALMDAFYKKVRPEFQNARCVLATIISAGSGKAVADVGLKGLACDFGPPVVESYPEARVLYVAEEHTVMENINTQVGRKIRLIPSHGCTTNNLYRRMYAARDGVVEEIWPIEGSGCLE